MQNILSRLFVQVLEFLNHQKKKNSFAELKTDDRLNLYFFPIQKTDFNKHDNESRLRKKNLCC